VRHNDPTKSGLCSHQINAAARQLWGLDDEAMRAFRRELANKRDDERLGGAATTPLCRR
jgi:hypothetical protein